jgi:hypothetical protein
MSDLRRTTLDALDPGDSAPNSMFSSIDLDSRPSASILDLSSSSPGCKKAESVKSSGKITSIGDKESRLLALLDRREWQGRGDSPQGRHTHTRPTYLSVEGQRVNDDVSRPVPLDKSLDSRLAFPTSCMIVGSRLLSRGTGRETSSLTR